jgi:3'(2'), 5'-bisphosphate nucleotidase
MSELQSLLERVVPVAVEAGNAVMQVYSRDFSSTEKDDKSPLTEADLASHHKIVDGLLAIDPSIPILSEEAKATPYEERKSWSRFWLVDPLDGTKEFIKRNGEFTVNIALVEDGQPILGVVHAPAIGATYSGIVGEGAWIETGGTKNELHATPYERGKLNVVASRSHAGPETEELIDRLRKHTGDCELVSIGSSLKLCLVAEGKAHLYPRLGPTMEWDTAAAHAVVEAAGATVRNVNGSEMSYNKENLLNPHFVVSSPGVPSV